MKRMFLLTIFLLTGTLIFSQKEGGNLIPVTTNSKAALSYYNQAMKYFDDVDLNKALETCKKALNQDPDFFMVNYQLASYYLLNRSGDNFDEYANAAINCKAKLSDAEELLKEALVRLKQDHANVTDLGKKLVVMYPNDPNSYNNLISFQSLAGDSVGIVETLNKAVKIASNPATFYNQLGYAYLALKQNVYDSKGDYYMYVKKYDKAYESYMIAYSMDHSFSHDKAELAKQLYEQTEGKKLEIISI